MKPVGEQLVGKVREKVMFPALLDVGREQEKLHDPPPRSSKSSDVYLQFLELERGLSKYTHTHTHLPPTPPYTVVPYSICDIVIEGQQSDRDCSKASTNRIKQTNNPIILLCLAFSNTDSTGGVHVTHYSENKDCYIQ